MRSTTLLAASVVVVFLLGVAGGGGCSAEVVHPAAGGGEQPGAGAGPSSGAGSPSSSGPDEDTTSGGDDATSGGDEGGGAVTSGGTGGARCGTLAQATQEWEQCASFDDWVAAGLDQLANQKVISGERCKDCHDASSLYGATVAVDAFEKWNSFPYLMKLVAPQVDASGCFAGFDVSTKIVDAGTAPCDDPACHPKYADPVGLIGAFQAFVDATNAKIAAGDCSQ